MKIKPLEILRFVLRKTILPIRKKKEAWLSTFRLSMAFRISMAYLKLMLTHGVLLLFGFFAVYMYSVKEDYDQISKDFISNVKESNYRGIENPYYARGFSMMVWDQDTGKIIYSDLEYQPGTSNTFFHGFHFDPGSKYYSMIINEKREFSAHDINFSATFQYNMTHSYQTFLSILWKLVILYLVVVALVIRKGKRSDVKLFEPVRVMSATANRLTVNNLHSERLNVEGTKNELKDLANVINAMLDRIETSYESQKQFVSDASHELRTPISVIQGYINMLNRWGSSNEEVLQESIEAIQNEARSMQDLVEKLLFLSRHDKKTLKLTKKRFNMRPLVEDMVKETKLVAVNRVINSPIIEDVIVYGDKQALKQAIRIFIDNAVKYTKDGDEITISCQKISDDCVITVSDTGIGMTRKDIDNIFNRFYRSEHVRNQNISGHGLGLSLAKLIILAHTGKIKVRSQYKKGSSFIITIPKRRY